MADAPGAEDLRRQLKRRGVHLNTLHATLRIARLDPTGKHYQKEREERLLEFVAMLGGIREPDLVAISRLTQPTLWRLVQRWQSSGAIRVVANYNDRVPGRRAKWLQPPESTDLPDERRAYLIETATLIKRCIPLWDAEQAEVAQEPPAPEQPTLPATPDPETRADDPILPPVSQPPAPLPAQIVVSIAKTPPPAAPEPQPEPLPVARVEASPPAVVPPVMVPPAAEAAPVIRLTSPAITYVPAPYYPPDPWEPDDPHRAMFEVTEHMDRRRQRERRERIARVLDHISRVVVWLIVGAVVVVGLVVFLPLLVYLVTGWDLLLMLFAHSWGWSCA